VKRYGGNISFSEPTLESREKVACDVQEQTGAMMIHPFNDARVIRQGNLYASKPFYWNNGFSDQYAYVSKPLDYNGAF
jgi:hypothetical protein